ncbi:nickel-dependent lactate racemase [Paenibacillus sp. J2TS4]|uniref:nickel-dependent lactate racemase n=1 Tax=Paenibacillus sp. J2TS4 TaxID=2807194 RepID=UPI001B21F89D|nr:nickel-dependent lactate racemase [Paenibacillus sp. J2TS4]GIP34288.1 transcriptional regulator [Paenibacillus sp. J2TS4]
MLCLGGGIIYKVPYGKGEASFRLPESVRPEWLLYGRPQGDDNNSEFHPASNPLQLIDQALHQPIGSLPLAELAKNCKRAVIIISDITRLCPSHLFLEPLLNELNSGGMADSSITVIVALGIHRSQTETELRTLTGNSVYRRVRVMNHSPAEEDCLYMGTTQQGTRVEINRHVVQADLRILTGNIEPHHMAGLSGGAKALLPGVASRRCIEANHALSKKTVKAVAGSPDNSIRQDMEEALSLVPAHFLFNVIVNHDKEMIAAFAGDVIEAHRAGVLQAKQLFCIPAAAQYDLVIASPGGHPKDIQLYQAIKTLQNASSFTRTGGTIVLIAECEEIYGNGLFQYWAETYSDRQQAIDKLSQTFILGAHKLEQLDALLQKHRIYLHSEVPSAVCELLGFYPANELQSTLDELTFARPIQAAIMPYGAITFADKNQ